MSEDERKRAETELQKLTDEQIKAADEVAAEKEKEILGK
ncbi:ribosome recycling factor [Pseudomonas aeruginosa]